MTTDRLFVILLVMLIPMTGCFGAVDNADAQDDSTTVDNSESTTTVINNYYNNTTTITTPVVEKFTAGGVIDYNIDYVTTSWGAREYTPYNFSTGPGEFASIHFFQENLADNALLITVCDDGSSYNAGTSTLDNGVGVWGSHSNCIHTVTVRSNDGGNAESYYESGEWIMSWNLVYSIESVTVV